MRGLSRAAVIVMALACAACQPEPASENVNTTVDTAPEPAGGKPEAAAPAARPGLDLATDGLDIVAPDGSARKIAFGADMAAVRGDVDEAIGTSTGQGENPECGAGPLTSVDYTGGLTLFFQQGKFVGWDLDGSGGWKTGGGIGIGSSRRALDAEGGIEMQDSTIGHEFTAGELSGLLDAPGPDGKVTNLWAGTNCIFR